MEPLSHQILLLLPCYPHPVISSTHQPFPCIHCCLSPFISLLDYFFSFFFSGHCPLPFLLFLLFCCILISCRVRREMPNWSYWTSDFWGWVAQMRELGVRQPIRDLARIFWAHFPIATSLGYDASPDNE
uniref:Uncharacterized protein n=1 Tax=Eptatretus burgeri TaxID=7764 RepID=A0A8C4PVX5_EPTBU